MPRTAWLRIIAVTALVTATAVLPTTPAKAAAAMSATSGYDNATASIGQIFETHLTVTNLSTAPDDEMTLTSIHFVPSCGTTGPIVTDCPSSWSDPGVFDVAPSAVGDLGTACAGTAFTTEEDNPDTGRLRIIPATPVVLGAPGAGDGDVCRIKLVISVQRTPSVDSRPGIDGVQTDGFGIATGIVATGVESSATGGSTITIVQAVPGLVTEVTEPEVPLGQSVTDNATLSGGADPTGTITFDLYGPDDDDCSQAPLASSTHPVSGPGGYTSSATTPTSVGGYRYIARYSGDANNQAVSGSCGDPGESVVVSAAEPPGIRVVKTATPLSRPEPGGTFSFAVAVTNTSAVDRTITAVVDDIYGDVATQGTCTDAVGTTLGPGDTYECAFPGSLTGNAGATQTDVVTVTAVDGAGAAVTDTDDAVVSLTDVPPTVELTKTALPEVRVAPGGLFTFGVVIVNTSAEAVTVTRLDDDVYGDLTRLTSSTCGQAVGTSLAPAEQLSCTFEGEFTGAVGAAQTDIVTVTVTDDDGSTGTAKDDATVRLVAADQAPSTTTAPSPTPTQPRVSTTTRAPGSLATTGAPSKGSALLAGVLVGLGMVLTGLGIATGERRRARTPSGAS